MKIRILAGLSMLFFIFAYAFAAPVSRAECTKAAENWLAAHSRQNEFSVFDVQVLKEEDTIIARVYELSPQGYIAVSAHNCLIPVIAYSFTGSFFDEDSGNLLAELVTADLSLRLQYINSMPPERIEHNQAEWRNLLQDELHLNRPEQWPPEGTTPTGGWLPENWTQSAPYNNFCPLDSVTGDRSIAGCPSVAMAQIMHYHRTANSVNFDDADDYFHNYAGRQFWIDNDYQLLDFLSFPQLNSWLDTLTYHYNYDLPVSQNEKAALVFACGVAARQVYTSAGSGTFGVDQALEAFQKFNFSQAILLDESTPTFYDQLAQNMMDALPVHFASVTPAWDSGHNFVVDGYNTDGFFHLNFGWGGIYNGWYSLPQGIPYGLTVVEGAVMNIIPQELPAGFIDGSVLLEPPPEDAGTVSLDITRLTGSIHFDLQIDQNGCAVFFTQVPIGNYQITAAYPDYETILLDPVTVNEYETTGFALALCRIVAPEQLSASLEDNMVYLNWQHSASRSFRYFNIFRNINSTAFALLDTTSQCFYIDDSLYPQTLTYGYRITAVYESDNESLPSNEVFIENIVALDETNIPPAVQLYNFPNPFNPQTRINFSLPEKNLASIKVYNLKGELIKVLIDESVDAGNYSVNWNGINDAGNQVGSGIYLIKLDTAQNTAVTRAVLLK